MNCNTYCSTSSRISFVVSKGSITSDIPTQLIRISKVLHSRGLTGYRLLHHRKMVKHVVFRVNTHHHFMTMLVSQVSVGVFTTIL